MSIKQILDFNINEELLDENIPKDLLNAYKNSDKAEKGGGSDLGKATTHSQLSPNIRRVSHINYGKSNYDILTYNQAKEYLRIGQPGVRVRDVAERLVNLRLIFDNKVAQWENKNGQIYYLYWVNIPWNKLHEAGSQGFNNKRGGLTNDTKFVATVSDIDICLKCADKIYKTDEYENILPSDYRDNNKTYKINNLVDMNTVDASTNTRGYDVHKPYDNFEKNSKTYVTNIDTGDHEAYRKYPSNWSHTRNLIATKNSLKNELQIYQNVLKKLNNERDTYDEEEYQEKLDSINTLIADVKAKYEDINRKIFKDNKDNHPVITDRIQDFNQNVIGKYVKIWQEVTDRIYQLKEEIKSEKGNISKPENEDVKNKINQLINVLEQDKDELERLKIDPNTVSDKTKSTLQELKNNLQRLEELKDQKLKQHLNILTQLEDELNRNIERDSQIHSWEAARKAERAAKNKEKELEPALSGIVKFKDFSNV